MKKVSAKIKADVLIDDSIKIFQEHIHEKPGLVHMLKKRPVLIGKLSDNFFKLRTLDNPPMELEGFFKEINEGTEIELLIKADSLKAGFMGLILGLGCPIIFVLFLVNVIQNPANIWIYIWTIISSLMLYVIAVIFTRMYYNEPNPDSLLKGIAKIFRGRIISKNEIQN